jgi:S1-C subfamily serine protease
MRTGSRLKLLLAAAAWFVATTPAAAQFGPPQIGPPQSGAWVPARPVGVSPQTPFAGATQAPAAQTSDRPGDGGVQWPLPASVRAHPAVCRIVVPTHDGESWGSGTLIDVTDRYGLVITNWHVVDEQIGENSVIFPDGFRSGGRVMKVDRDWDLAAIAIWRPSAAPVPLATQVPQVGETLSIAGYGSGQYRALSGRCAQYLSPGPQFPFDMVELTAAARNGDSGGPIFNARGELAGVLFGQGEGRTSGSHVGRVRWFLASVLPSAAPNSAVAASRATTPPQPNASGLANAPRQPVNGGGLINSPLGNAAAATPTNPAMSPADPPRSQVAATPIAERSNPAVAPWGATQQPGQPVAQRPAFPSVPHGGAQPVASIDSDSAQSTLVTLWHAVAGTTPIDRLKTIFAGMGTLALLGRIVSFVRGGKAKVRAT